MRFLSLSLVTLALSLIIGTPAAAQSPQSSAMRLQVTVSAEIVSGEAVRFGPVMGKNIENRKTNATRAIMLTRGTLTTAADAPLLLAEFQ
ncbi:MAG: hypothetical protein ABJO01_04370 [Parasphingorhabdus sp.]|uniref:hypothetical protein n=1 Tax=Parasphingorhabdus sp. TaxID=2709688 RepID=UPI003298F18E